jgi:SAM-dependent methyltransferase
MWFAGPGVDVVCGADSVVERFGFESFDVIISTEMLEHVRDWKKVVSNMKRVCKPNGLQLITTRSYGFTYHPQPLDCWRYELKDIKAIFSDFTIESIEEDPLSPGVFLRARKPVAFTENELPNYRLFSLQLNDRITRIDEKDVNIVPIAYRKARHRWKKRQKLKRLARRLLFLDHR